jgi:hypothetical protein
MPERKTSSLQWVEMSEFPLKTEAEFSLRNVVFKLKAGRWITSRIVIVIKMLFM